MKIFGRRAFLAAAALGLWACGGGEEAPKPAGGNPTHRPTAERLAGVSGVENFARMNAHLYRGAQPTEEGFRRLKEMGIKTVIDFRSNHSTRKQAEAAGLVAVEIPLRADFEAVPPTEAEVRKFFDVVLDPAKQPVYIHCAFGKDRTGTMAALYRMEVDGWTPEEAIEEMEAFGYHNIYRDLINFVRSYKPRGHAARTEPK